MTDQGDQGLLRVSAGDDVLPIEVRDASFKLIHQGITGEDLALDPGIYQVEAQLPDGNGAKEVVSIDPNDMSVLDLGAQPLTQPTPQSVGTSMEIADVGRTLIGEVLGGLLGRISEIPQEAPEVKRRRRPRPRTRVGSGTPSWSLRLVKGSFIRIRVPDMRFLGVQGVNLPFGESGRTLASVRVLQP
jgi:hypothetical protein